MGFENVVAFNATKVMQDKIIDSIGVNMTHYKIVNVSMEGYEDILNKGNISHATLKGFIDFTPKRGVYYHYNWFPEDVADLVLGYFYIGSGVKENDYIRTATIEQVSIYGDLLFKVIRAEDDGKYRVLRRTWFLRPVMDKALYEVLSLT